MQQDIQSNDKDFVEQLLKFYKNIHNYASLFEIDRNELASFKSDVEVFLFIADNRYRSFTEGFLQYNIMILRNKLERLFMLCSSNKKYTLKIGEDLGMIAPQHRLLWPLSWANKGSLLHWLVNVDFNQTQNTGYEKQ